MEGMGGRKIINREGQVKFVITEIVRLLPVFEPGQLDLVWRLTVAEKDENETSSLLTSVSCSASR
jgi:hypothetical protein